MQLHRYTPLLAAAIVAVASACTASESRSYDLVPQNDSGVEGTVTLTDLGSGRTRVEISVASAGNPDMPAHVHAGSCDDMIPQPLFALVNVVDGSSTTEVAASLDELTADDVVVNLHQSNEAMNVSTACGGLSASG